jgi:hypothetical protein
LILPIPVFYVFESFFSLGTCHLLHRNSATSFHPRLFAR